MNGARPKPIYFLIRLVNYQESLDRLEIIHAIALKNEEIYDQSARPKPLRSLNYSFSLDKINDGSGIL
jgi:hypothetical protein